MTENYRPHIPGPWNIRLTHIEDASGSRIATVDIGNPKTTIGTVVSTARLISSSPELLAALEKFVEYEKLMGGNGVNDAIAGMIAYDELVKLAYPAIAKAKGTEHEPGVA